VGVGVGVGRVGDEQEETSESRRIKPVAGDRLPRPRMLIAYTSPQVCSLNEADGTIGQNAVRPAPRD
jgi:hypothetical protein